MKLFLARLLLLLVLLTNDTVGYADGPLSWNFTSTKTQTTLIELFTSEGCSSCPPADRWLSRWKNEPRLWKEVVPLAFHVDYWNDLGWTDRFAKSAFSARQSLYVARGYAGSVYTPGVFINSREWRGWIKNPQSKPDSTKKAGTLSVAMQPQDLSAVFMPVRPVDKPLLLNVAVLGFDLQSAIYRGENQGKVLDHDFVVLEWRSFQEQSPHRWHFPLAGLDLSEPHALAVAFWVSSVDDPTPLQATGGWLTSD